MAYSNDTACRAELTTIPSAAKVSAYHLINDECLIGERELFALVYAVACVLAHDGPDGGTETARCAFETVVPPVVALAAVRALLQDELAV